MCMLVFLLLFPFQLLPPALSPPCLTPFAAIYAHTQSWADILKQKYNRRSEREKIQLEIGFPQPSGHKENCLVVSASLEYAKHSFWEAS